MARCTSAILEDVVPIMVRGEGGGVGRLPRDDGLVGRFMSWLTKVNIVDVGLGGHVGGGSCLLFFRREDVPAVRAWLRGQGVVEDAKKTLRL